MQADVLSSHHACSPCTVCSGILTDVETTQQATPLMTVVAIASSSASVWSFVDVGHMADAQQMLQKGPNEEASKNKQLELMADAKIGGTDPEHMADAVDTPSGPVWEAGLAKAKDILRRAKEHDCKEEGVIWAKSCMQLAEELQQDVNNGDVELDKALCKFEGSDTYWDQFPAHVVRAKRSAETASKAGTSSSSPEQESKRLRSTSPEQHTEPLPAQSSNDVAPSDFLFPPSPKRAETLQQESIEAIGDDILTMHKEGNYTFLLCDPQHHNQGTHGKGSVLMQLEADPKFKVYITLHAPCSVQELHSWMEQKFADIKKREKEDGCTTIGYVVASTGPSKSEAIVFMRPRCTNNLLKQKRLPGLVIGRYVGTCNEGAFKGKNPSLIYHAFGRLCSAEHFRNVTVHVEEVAPTACHSREQIISLVRGYTELTNVDWEARLVEQQLYGE